VLALFVAGAPAALTACELMCASAGAESHATGHSCHEAQSPGTTSVGGGAHRCGHGDALPVSSAKLAPQEAPVPDLAPITLAAYYLAGAAPLRPFSSAASPLDHPKLITQLRI
jgi:hypothetical protein